MTVTPSSKYRQMSMPIWIHSWTVIFSDFKVIPPKSPIGLSRLTEIYLRVFRMEPQK